MARQREWGRNRSLKKGVFDPQDTNRVKHTRVGVWDYYEEKDPRFAGIPGSTRIEHFVKMMQDLTYVWRLTKDVLNVRGCGYMLSLYMILELLNSLLPALRLWYSGQMLKVVQVAVDSRTVDKNLLLSISLAQLGCSVCSRLIAHGKSRLAVPINSRLRQHFAAYIFQVRARLDLPTSEDPAVSRQLENASPSSHSDTAFETILMVNGILMNIIQIVSTVSVLAAVLRDQLDGPLLALLTFAHSMFDWIYRHQFYVRSAVWAATTTNKDYIQMQGLKSVVSFPEHRKELVAGNLGEFVTTQFFEASKRVGDDANDFMQQWRLYKLRDRLSLLSMLQEPMRQLPQIVFALRAVQYPASIPVSLASLSLIQQTTSSFSMTIYNFIQQTGSIADKLETVRKLYDLANIQNRIKDGTVPYPEDVQKLKHGITVEFRNVSFKYPGSDVYALRDVSFKLLAGQLCVIVGANGSGKSTVLKLITRLYDVTEGEILIDGHDIRTLKLADLRQAISVLFQDYTHFPLSIRDNIALGDPSSAGDDEHVHLAAELGGASAFIEKLPDGYDTFLDRPVRDYYSGIPEGTTTLFGRTIDYSAVRGAGHMSSTGSPSLSGGQMQRLAVSRTFMRSVVSKEEKVGLLLFDEPSASLDPTAEHDLFARLRELRGNKTMLFSSHRFGNLTRHADLILYMNDTVIVEAGTHDELLKQEGEYARIWMLQAQAFL